jgi:hypothetical protein
VSDREKWNERQEYFTLDRLKISTLEGMIQILEAKREAKVLYAHCSLVALSQGAAMNSNKVTLFPLNI